MHFRCYCPSKALALEKKGDDKQCINAKVGSGPMDWGAYHKNMAPMGATVCSVMYSQSFAYWIV